jgi:hypothetical protein
LATTSFFEEKIEDHAGFDIKIDLEFGRSSYTSENLIYLKVDGNTVLLSPEVGRKLVEAMSRLGSYLGYDE